MFQRKIYKRFKDLPNVFGIADDISVVRLTAMVRTMITPYENYYKFANR